MIHLAKQAKRDVEKNFHGFEMRTVTESNPERDFFSFMSKESMQNVLPILAQNKRILHMTCT